MTPPPANTSRNLRRNGSGVDPQTLDLTIRKGVNFHNGDPLTADDVVFTLNYVVSPEAKVVTKQNVNWIKSAEKIGDDQVRIHLVGPFPAAIEYLAGPVPIYPEKYFKQVGLTGILQGADRHGTLSRHRGRFRQGRDDGEEHPLLEGQSGRTAVDRQAAIPRHSRCGNPLGRT